MLPIRATPTGILFRLFLLHGLSTHQYGNQRIKRCDVLLLGYFQDWCDQSYFLAVERDAWDEESEQSEAGSSFAGGFSAHAE